MTPAERRIRNQLPIIRFFQSYVPLRLSNWLIRQGLGRVRLGTDTKRETLSANGVSCERIVPSGSRTDRVLLYLHGGGFVYGLTPPHLEMVAHLATRMNSQALLVDYRVAPEHPFPAALDDCITAYRWLIRQGYSARNIVIAGDSAGGNLALTTMMALRDNGDALPVAAACLSPVGDLSDRSDPTAGFKDPLLPARATRMYKRAYVADGNGRNPLVSPVFGDWRGLPPLLVHVGEDEILRDDAVRIKELAEAAGVDVQVAIYPRMWHVWQLYLDLPQAISSLEAIAQFLQLHLGAVAHESA